MVENTANGLIEHHLFERPLPQCPACGSRKLVPVSRDANVDYLCRRCSSCWHVELGAYWRVDGPGALESKGAVTADELDTGFVSP